MFRLPWPRRRAPEPQARVVIDGEEIEGYELPPEHYGDAHAVEAAWAEHRATLREQARTRGSRALTAFLRSVRERDAPQPPDASLAAGADVWRPSEATRKRIRDAAADLANARDIPPERFPGHKAIYCANLEGWLGGFTLGLLNALEAVESERDRLATDRYIIRERPRLGVWEVIDTHEHSPVFVGVREDCEEWVKDPASRPTDKPADYPFR